MKTCLITGGGSGIGFHVAKYFSQKSYEVFFVGRNKEKIKTAENSILESGGLATGFVVDVSNEKKLNPILAEIFKNKPLDVLINNAGVIRPIGKILETNSEEWLNALKINAFGNYLCSKFALQKMVSAKRGTILSVSSGAASSPMEGWSAYCSSKAASAMLTRAIHLEYGEKGIRVFGIRPGVVDTDMQTDIRSSGINKVSKLKRSDLISPEIIAKAIYRIVEKGDEYLGNDIDIRDAEFLKKLNLSLEIE